LPKAVASAWQAVDRSVDDTAARPEVYTISRPASSNHAEARP
jgi:hypothetical protein